MRIFGILRGFPGLGRVVSGTTILETLRDEYGCSIEIVSYLQGQVYLNKHGYKIDAEVTSLDYSSIGLLPTNSFGAYIFKRIKSFNPDIILVDGEPLLIHSIRISFPKVRIVALLNPSDVDNPQNDKEAMDFFNSMYCQADLSIVHGLRKVECPPGYRHLLSIGTILRREILDIHNIPTHDIYCVLGGGTVNVGNNFAESTIKMAKLCIDSARLLSGCIVHVVCSSDNIYDVLNDQIPDNVILHKDIIEATEYYAKACLVITRSGRNTLSELAYLGIPAISFVSGCNYRRVEQEQNLLSLNAFNICSASMDLSVMDFVQLCKEQMNRKTVNPRFVIGNEIAIKEILSL